MPAPGCKINGDSPNTVVIVDITMGRSRELAASTTACLADMPSREFCVRLLDETGVMLVPGSVMDMEGWLRVGYANNAQVLRDGLARLSAFLAS